MAWVSPRGGWRLIPVSRPCPGESWVSREPPWCPLTLQEHTDHGHCLCCIFSWTGELLSWESSIQTIPGVLSGISAMISLSLSLCHLCFFTAASPEAAPFQRAFLGLEPCWRVKSCPEATGTVPMESQLLCPQAQLSLGCFPAPELQGYNQWHSEYN